MATILVIEDEAPIRENIVRFLRLEGHRAVQAGDGRAGLEAAKAHRPDLILCDVMMPLMGGFEVLAAIQLEPRLKSVPFIFLSASAEKERLVAAMELGARNYVTKPFNLAELRALLLEYLPPGDSTHFSGATT